MEVTIRRLVASLYYLELHRGSVSAIYYPRFYFTLLLQIVGATKYCADSELHFFIFYFRSRFPGEAGGVLRKVLTVITAYFT